MAKYTFIRMEKILNDSVTEDEFSNAMYTPYCSVM